MYKVIVFALLAGAAVVPVRAQDPLSGSLQRDLTAAQPGQAGLRQAAAVFDDAAPAQKKSAGLAAVYSLVLPGAGETYVSGIEAGKYPLIAEGALWLTWGTMEYYGRWLQDDARRFAVVHAGVATTTADDLFYVNRVGQDVPDGGLGSQAERYILAYCPHEYIRHARHAFLEIEDRDLHDLPPADGQKLPDQGRSLQG